MTKIDFKKQLKHLYQPPAKEVVEVEVPGMNYLMVDGRGDPSTSRAFAEAVEALFSVSYTVKFMVKKGPMAIDYGVLPLEGLWWDDDIARFSMKNKHDWNWTVMMMQPDFVTAAMIGDAVAKVKEKKKGFAFPQMRFGALKEGRCAQILYVGPFSEEAPTVERVHRFIDARGRMTGKHHEIYLSDIRKTAEAKWKTIVRQPME